MCLQEICFKVVNCFRTETNYRGFTGLDSMVIMRLTHIRLYRVRIPDR